MQDIMKKVIYKFLVLGAVLSALNSVSALETDISLYNEMNSAYNSGFYPGCERYADRLISVFPDSVFVPDAYSYRGECLVLMGQYDEAEEVLKNAWKSADKKSGVRENAVFWLGRLYELQKKYNESLVFYFDYCKSAGSEGKNFPEAILNSGRIFYAQEDYKNAVRQFEYCVQNGLKFKRLAFEDSVLKLADSYNKSGVPEKTLSLYSKFSPASLSSRTYWIFTEYAGDAYVQQKKYKAGYDYYCKVLACPEKSLSANALKKAYSVSSSHKSEVGADPGTVLKTAQANLSDSSELLSEFWTRMGLDAFNDGDYKKASSYFDEAEKTASGEVQELIFTYRAEIALTKNPVAQTAETAEKILKTAEEKLSLNSESRYFQEYSKLHIKYECIMKDWKTCVERKSSIRDFDYSTKYYLAMAYYNLGQYQEAASLLSGSESMLYALTLARQMKLKESADVFSAVDRDTKLSDSQRLNYAKVLLYSGRYRESQIEAAKCSQNEAKYILGLAQFNTRSWKYCEENFDQFLKKGSSDKTAVSYAQFYLGYSQYRLGKNQEAYKNLSSFAEKYPDHELIWNARMTAGNAAVQIQKYESGIKQAEAAVKVAKNQADREEAVLLCAEINVDAENYDRAVSILEPYTSVKNEFGMKCLFQIARIYEKQGLVSEADRTYIKVASDFNGKKTGEEALYRRGELYYAEKDFSKALERFNEYIRKYSAGSFVDAACFYAADCLNETGNVQRAIMQYQSLLKNYSESSYVYTASRNLMELYRREGKYLESIKTADFLMEKFGDQAKNDGVEEYILQLNKLKSGYSEEIVRQQLLYENEGKSATVSGRICGTELVRLFCERSELSGDGIGLAKELLPLQEKNIQKESIYAAQNALIIAKYEKQSGRHKTAADYFLKAAKYYRNNKDQDEKASYCLYEAYDSFLACDMTGDANSTAKTLKELYPSSKYARSAKVQD